MKAESFIAKGGGKSTTHLVYRVSQHRSYHEICRGMEAFYGIKLPC